MNNKEKVQYIAKRVSFLMEHQEVLPDLKELAADLYPYEAFGLLSPDDRESPVYLMGAYDALMALIKALEEKGSQL